jgi:hypothetical protein
MTKDERDAIVALTNRFDEFMDQYETDMRGDKELDSANIGLLNEIRELKKFPSFLNLLVRKPVQTILVSLTLFLALDAMSTFGILRSVAGLFGLVLPGWNK